MPNPTGTPEPTATAPPIPTATAIPVTPPPEPTATETEPATPASPPALASLAVGQVVHVHALEATSWDFGADYYGRFVRQDVVDAMVDRGVVALTGAASVVEAWRAIVPGYQPGKGIAVKVSFNNCWTCDVCETGCAEDALKIDSLIHPVNAIVRGLKQAYPDLAESDVWVYDATVGYNPPYTNRQIPARFTQGCLYPGVRFLDQGCHSGAGYASTDPSAKVAWQPPVGVTLPERQVTDVLVNATYLINLPGLKRHGSTEVTLAFKNHVGSISNFEPFHAYTFRYADTYTPSYSPLVDLYRNPHIQGKTVLILADGLYGSWAGNDVKPRPWTTFGNQAPNSLLFSTDPVAIDAVMCDLLHTELAQQGEGGLRAMADDYLKLAASAGLGIYERGDPWAGGYSRIAYQRIDL
ncbi:MAG: DUF362 domain-containing protein [Anaerolineae bacterium]